MALDHVTCWILAEEADLAHGLMARMLQFDERDWPTAEPVASWRAAGVDVEVPSERLAERPSSFADIVAPLPRGNACLTEGR